MGKSLVLNKISKRLRCDIACIDNVVTLSLQLLMIVKEYLFVHGMLCAYARAAAKTAGICGDSAERSSHHVYKVDSQNKSLTIKWVI